MYQAVRRLFEELATFRTAWADNGQDAEGDSCILQGRCFSEFCTPPSAAEEIAHGRAHAATLQQLSYYELQTSG